MHSMAEEQIKKNNTKVKTQMVHTFDDILHDLSIAWSCLVVHAHKYPSSAKLTPPLHYKTNIKTNQPSLGSWN
jgi:hypothetical protein